jgi:hypothetical protein
MSQLARGTLGVVTLLLIAWLLSERRRLVSWRSVALGILVEILLAAVLLKMPFTATVFVQVNRGVIAVQQASQTGSSFVFGFLGGGPAPYEPSGTGSDLVPAFRILPLIIVVSGFDPGRESPALSCAGGFGSPGSSGASHPRSNDALIRNQLALTFMSRLRDLHGSQNCRLRSFMASPSALHWLGAFSTTRRERTRKSIGCPLRAGHSAALRPVFAKVRGAGWDVEGAPAWAGQLTCWSEPSPAA